MLSPHHPTALAPLPCLASRPIVENESSRTPSTAALASILAVSTAAFCTFRKMDGAGLWPSATASGTQYFHIYGRGILTLYPPISIITFFLHFLVTSLEAHSVVLCFTLFSHLRLCLSFFCFPASTRPPAAASHQLFLAHDEGYDCVSHPWLPWVCGCP